MERTREKVPDHYRYVIADIVKQDTTKVQREMLSGQHNMVQWAVDKGTFASTVHALYDTLDYSEDSKEAMMFGLQKAGILSDEKPSEMKLVCFFALAVFPVIASTHRSICSQQPCIFFGLYSGTPLACVEAAPPRHRRSGFQAGGCVQYFQEELSQRGYAILFSQF